jgi:hypothetical protein
MLVECARHLNRSLAAIEDQSQSHEPTTVDATAIADAAKADFRRATSAAAGPDDRYGVVASSRDTHE